MDCVTCSSLLSAFHAGDLAEVDSRGVAAHLENCDDCAGNLATFGALDELVRGLPRYSPSTRALLRVKSASAFPVPPAPARMEFGTVLDMDELAEFLRVGRETLEEYLDQIPCFELGGKLLFRRKSVEAWIESREHSYGFQRTHAPIKSMLVAESLDEGDERWMI